MKNEITTMPVNDIMIMAKTFAESGMFTDAKEMAKAFVKIQAGQEIGVAPFQAMTGIHIIQGKPTVGAGIMASKVKGSGKYDYRVLQQDESACILEFFEGKVSLGKSSFTIEDAKKAGTQNIAKFPRNMLFARAISNGIKWYTPDVFLGPVYVPEEMGMEEQTTEDIAHEVIEPTIVIPTMNQSQHKKLIDTATAERLGEVLNMIEEGKLNATSAQVLTLEERLIELKTV
jgi:hypothetical protein